MKNRVKAIFLAASLAVGAFGVTGAYAQEAATEGVTEAAEAAEELSTEVSDAGADTTAADAATTYEDYVISLADSYMSQLSALTDEQLESIISSGTDASTIAMASNWMNVKEELGAYQETEESSVTTDGTVYTVVSKAKYDGVNDKTEVVVTTEIDVQQGSVSMNWEVDYPMSTLIQQAGLNTLMGVCIVFLVLLFLSFLIGQMHWIPDLMNRKDKEKEAAQKAAPAAAPVQTAVEEEEVMDDGELIAVIAAAIAASENTTTDGFVVRSIRKSNKKNWQNA